MRNLLQMVLAAFVCLSVSSFSLAQEKVDAAMKARFDKFERLLTGSKFKGSFTLDDKPLNDLHEEEYDIEKVEKLPEPDLWSIKARIKYGNKDFTVPVPLYVRWAGETPVMTMDKITLPGFGTFSARVVLHVDKYAGTWQHDDKGGICLVASSWQNKATRTPNPQQRRLASKPSGWICESFIVVFCSAKVAQADATFAEAKGDYAAKGTPNSGRIRKCFQMIAFA